MITIHLVLKRLSCVWFLLELRHVGLPHAWLGKLDVCHCIYILLQVLTTLFYMFVIITHHGPTVLYQRFIVMTITYILYSSWIPSFVLRFNQTSGSLSSRIASRSCFNLGLIKFNSLLLLKLTKLVLLILLVLLVLLKTLHQPSPSCPYLWFLSLLVLECPLQHLNVPLFLNYLTLTLVFLTTLRPLILSLTQSSWNFILWKSWDLLFLESLVGFVSFVLRLRLLCAIAIIAVSKQVSLSYHGMNYVYVVLPLLIFLIFAINWSWLRNIYLWLWWLLLLICI